MPNLPLTNDKFYKGDGNPYKDVIKSADLLIKKLQEASQQAIKTAEALSLESKQNPKETAKDYKQLSNTITELGRNIDAANKANQEAERLDIAKRKLLTEQSKINIKNRLELQNLTKETKNLIKWQTAQRNSIDRLNAANAILRQRTMGISAETEEGRKRIAAYNKVIDKNTIKVKQLSDAQTRQFKNIGNYGSALQGVGSALGIFTSGTLLAAGAIRKGIDVTKQAIEINREFEKTFANVLTLLDKAQKQKFGDILAIGAVDIMANYGIEIQDVNNALFDVISNGVDAGDAIEFLDKSARLAIAGNAQLSDVIKGATKVYTVYKDEVESVDEILNAFFAAQVKGATNVQLLANNIGKLAGTAKIVGIPINELFGTFAGLTKSLDGTEESATALVNLINSIIQVTPQAQKEFEKYGIETGIVAVKQNGLLNTLLKVVKATKENEDALTELIPNIRAFKGIATLSAESIAELEENIAQLNDQELSAALLQEAFNEQMDTGQKQADLLKGSWNRLLITLGGGESIFKKIGTGIRLELKEKLDKLSLSVELFKLQWGDMVNFIELSWDRLTGELSKDEFRKILKENVNASAKAFVEILNRYKLLDDVIKENNDVLDDENELTEEQIDLINKYNQELGTNLELTKESYEIAKKYFEGRKKEIETLETLKDKLQKLEKDKLEIDKNDIQRLLAKEKEIQQIKDEISVLENLYNIISEKPEDVEIKVDLKVKYDDISDILNKLEKDRLNEINKFTEDALKAREDIHSRHYDNVFQIFANYQTKRQIEGQNYSAKEIKKIDTQNQREAKAYQQLASTLVSISNDILQTRLDNINREIDAKNQQINEQEQQVNRELELLRSGAANEYQTEKEKLRKLQEERNRDIREREKIQKQQQTINTLTQISELATAVATIINSAVSELGWAGVIAGLAAAAAAIIGFETYKSEAESAAYAEEGDTFIKKGTHIESGKRHSKGGNKYSSAEFEQGEAVSVFSRKATSKYKDEIYSFENALNNDQFEMYRSSLATLKTNNVIINNDYTRLLEEQKTTNRLLKRGKFAIIKNGNIVFYSYDGKLLGTNLGV